MEYLQKITTVIPAEDVEQMHLPAMPEQVRLAFHLRKEKAEPGLKILYRWLFSRKPRPFCIALSLADASDPQWTVLLLPLFNHPDYIVEAMMPRILLIGHEPDSPVCCGAQHLDSQARQQGWSGVKAALYNPEMLTEGEGLVMLPASTGRDMRPLSRYFLPGSLLQPREFIFLARSPAQAEELIRHIAALEEQYAMQNGELHRAAVQLARQADEVSALKQQLAHLYCELENQKTYTRLINPQKQLEEILRFYHAEYEVLPLWYKRLGHIIKVLMGKRSFRSLFDDHKKNL